MIKNSPNFYLLTSKSFISDSKCVRIYVNEGQEGGVELIYPLFSIKYLSLIYLGHSSNEMAIMRYGYRCTNFIVVQRQLTSTL